MKQFIQNEPVVTSVIVTAVVAIVGLAVSFGAPITPEQADAIQVATTAVLPLVFLAVRGFVTPNAKVDTEYTHDNEVVEYAVDGHVLAGEASELPTNTHVREIGDLDASV